jgi:purine nucleosidase
VSTIIDTDPEADDAVALMLAAASPELQLLAVTRCSAADVEVTPANARIRPAGPD